MSGFIFVAALLTLLVVAAVVYPLLRRGGSTPAAWATAGVVALVVVGGGAALYPLWSNWDWQRPMPAADSPAGMVGRLARRLEKQPDDLQGWLTLGRSYAVLGQYPLSARAYQRADTLAKGTNRDALIGVGEALVAIDRSALGGRAGQLFEKALELDPGYVKGILYGAFAAAERKDLPLARTRFKRLLEGDPPDELRGIIEQQLAAMDAQGVAVTGAGARPGAGTGAGAGAGAGAESAVVAVPVRITLAAAVAGKATAGAPLFVLARMPGQRGPPLAAKRLEAKFPQEVELLSSDAMVAGTGFSAGQELEIEARVANGGSANSRSGDPFGTVRVKAGAKTRVTIEINQLKP